MSATVGDVHTFFGKGAEFDGKLTFDGSVRIDGKFSGEIHTKDTLVVGEGANVNAEISAGTVVINGTVEGNIKTTQAIDLRNTGRIRGNVETPQFSVERGSFFEGSCKMDRGSSQSKQAPMSDQLPPQLPVEIQAQMLGGGGKGEKEKRK
jgi:cytoskeletal protein CcmA (bactofilin family)